MSRGLRLCLSSIAPLALAACAIPLDEPADPFAERSEAVVVPARGGASTLDVGEWNLEWFGSTGMGPTNESLQLQNAHDVIAGADLDLWGVEEIVSATQFNTLVGGLPGYAGLLANSASVTNGSSYYTSAEQKVGVIYKTSVVTINSAKIILTANDYDFGGRPPLELSTTLTVGGSSINAIVIVLHAKATGDTDSYNRRKNGSLALKAYLDSTYPTQKVFVVGDFNDDLDTSISAGKTSPYANFVSDAGDYTFLSKEFTDAGESTTASYPEAIDHHLVTNELVPLYIAGSAEVYRVDQYIPSYSSTTSDHFPTLTRYALGGGSPAQLVINEVLANEPGSSTGGEFVEIVNVGGTAAALGGFTLSDATAVRHTFPAGASLGAGSAIAVFGAASGIPAGLSNAVAASSGGLNLGNSGDSVILKNGGGATVTSVTYDSTLASTDGVSMNRSPDASPSGGFVLHTALSAATSSPGKRASGASF